MEDILRIGSFILTRYFLSGLDKIVKTILFQRSRDLEIFGIQCRFLRRRNNILRR